MDVVKAKRLLELLRRRTEARGATAGEAAQAAALAEKLIKRFGLDGDDGQYSESVQMKQNVFPEWARIIAMAVRQRFGCQAIVTRQVGERSIVRFVGPEHAVSVSRWLFLAVLQDLVKEAHKQARASGAKGPQLVRFRNRFLSSAAWSVHTRLNRKYFDALRLKYAGQEDTNPPEKAKRKLRHRTRALTSKQREDANILSMASWAGFEAGEAVQLSSDVIGDEPEPLRLAAPRATGGEA